MLSYNPSSRIWTTASSGASRDVFNEGFSAPATVRFGPPPPALGRADWEQAVGMLTSDVALIRRADGEIQVNQSSDGGDLPFIITPRETSGGSFQSSYDVSVALTGGSLGVDDEAALVFGYRDEANYCTVFWSDAGATTDLYLLKRSSGVLSTLSEPAKIDAGSDDVVSLEVRGRDLTVKVNGESRMTASDDDCLDQDRLRLAVEELSDTDDAGSAGRLDDFSVAAFDAADGGIALRPGTNILTVTAINAAGKIATDSITITFATDTRGPTVKFTDPASGASHSTDSATVNLAVLASDERGVASCTYTCRTCAPASGQLARTSIDGAWSAHGVGLSVGANTVSTVCVDPLGNEGRASLTVTRTPVQPASDSVAPTILVPANFVSSKRTARITGTARDNVSVTRVRWTCDRCPSGTAVMVPGRDISWSATLALAPGINVVTFIAEDARGNRGTGRQIVVYGDEPPRTGPVTIAWDWTGSKTARFRLWCNRAIVKNFQEAELTRNVRTPDLSELQTTIHGLKGVVECTVTAYEVAAGRILESDSSNAIILNMSR